jgi:hypothetical protein
VDGIGADDAVDLWLNLGFADAPQVPDLSAAQVRALRQAPRPSEAPA